MSYLHRYREVQIFVHASLWEIHCFLFDKVNCSALDLDWSSCRSWDERRTRLPFPFVAAPVCFFGDDETKSKYRSAYFENDDRIWNHGDLIEVTGSVGTSGGIVIHGRSDTTLKPGRSSDWYGGSLQARRGSRLRRGFSSYWRTRKDW